MGLLLSPLPLRAETPSPIEVLDVPLDGPVATALAAIQKNIPDGQISEKSGTLTLGEFTSPSLKFGADVQTPGDYSDDFRIMYSLEDPQIIIGIQRDASFSKESAPTISVLESTLVGKYGPPLLVTGTGSQSHNMVWHFGGPTGINLHPTFNGSVLQYVDCTNNAEQAMFGMYQGNYSLTLSEIAPTCGVWITVTISPSSSNIDLVDSYELRATDISKIASSRDYIYTVLKNGDAQKKASETQKASSLKPQL